MWNALSIFYDALPSIDTEVTSKELNIAAQSYGGHTAPGFFNYFRKQNQALVAEDAETPFELGSVITVAGLIDSYLQAPGYVKFAEHNTHGVYVNSMVAAAMAFNLEMQGTGCLAGIDQCTAGWEQIGDPSSLYLNKICVDAAAFCRAGVELPFLTYSEAGHAYDVRNITEHPLPPGHWMSYVNTAPVQQALGTNLNYTVGSSVNPEVLAAMNGDWVRRVFIDDIAELVDAGVRVSLWYGDSDVVCNWMGGEMVSLGINHTNAEAFKNAGYTRFEGDDGTYYGDTREAGNYAFTRIFDAGHAIPYYQPEATLALFNRTIHGMDSAKGTQRITPDFATVGSEHSTYSQVENAKKAKRDASLKSAKFRF
jgi:carboxypeptidase C (cathepsin A)